MARISSQQAGITHEELREAIPDHLSSKDIHLFWVDKSPHGKGRVSLAAKIEIDGQQFLLNSISDDPELLGSWETGDPNYHTNPRLLALERILTDPANEEFLLSV